MQFLLLLLRFPPLLSECEVHYNYQCLLAIVYVEICQGHLFVPGSSVSYCLECREICRGMKSSFWVNEGLDLIIVGG